MGKPTEKMVNFARLLIDKAEEKEVEHPYKKDKLEDMEFEEVSGIIDELKAELGWE